MKESVLPEGSYSNVIVKGQDDNLLSIKPNLNTLKYEIKWDKDVDFTKDNSIGTLLGFD